MKNCELRTGYLSWVGLLRGLGLRGLVLGGLALGGLVLLVWLLTATNPSGGDSFVASEPNHRDFNTQCPQNPVQCGLLTSRSH